MNTERPNYHSVHKCVKSALSKNGILDTNKIINRHIHFLNIRFNYPGGGFFYDLTNDITISILDKIDLFDSEKSLLQTWVNWQTLGWVSSFVKHSIKREGKVESDVSVEKIQHFYTTNEGTPEDMIDIKNLFKRIEKDKVLFKVLTGEISHLRAAELEGTHVNTIYRRIKKYKKLVDKMHEYLDGKIN